MTRRIRNAAFLAVLSASVLASAGARAEILGARLQVNGMSCPVCSFGVETRLRDVDGVIGVEILLDEGRVLLKLSAGNDATVEAFGRAVRKAGFELGALAIDARGRLEVRESDTWLDVHGSLRLKLFESTGNGTRPLSPEARARIPVDADGLHLASGRVEHREGEFELILGPL